MRRQTLKILALSPCLIGLTLCHASARTNNPAPEIQRLLDSRQSQGRLASGDAAPGGRPLFATSRDGHLSNLVAGPSNFFPVTSVVTGRPELTARNFITEYAGALGVQNPRLGFEVKKAKPAMAGHVVRFKQTYQGIPVFGSDLIIKMNPSGGVQYLLNHALSDTTALDDGSVSTSPDLSAAEAVDRTLKAFLQKNRADDLTFTTPQLRIFVPALHHMEGPVRLVWEFLSRSAHCDECNRKILLDAHSGETVRSYPLNISCSRAIYDANNTFNEPVGVVPPCGIVDADMVWNHLGDTCNYYANHFGRDSVDDDGMWVKATVRYCKAANPCPYANAYWSGNDEQMYFGDGYYTDDLVGHEYTHGVTFYTSEFAYENESGALSESFSDVFGEYIDWSNGTGNDAASNRWEIAEDMPGDPMRSMKYPGLYGDPDRYFSTNKAPYAGNPSEANDFGGVHSNNGINNKLCYLLTDGDFFNGQFVSGLGELLVSRAYYDALTFYLGELSGYAELYYALVQSSCDWSWTPTQRNNLYRACRAVEINHGERDIWVDKTYNHGDSDGTQYRPFNSINWAMLYAYPGDRMIIVSNDYNETGTYELIMEIMPTQGVVTIGITNAP